MTFLLRGKLIVNYPKTEDVECMENAGSDGFGFLINKKNFIIFVEKKTRVCTFLDFSGKSNFLENVAFH